MTCLKYVQNTLGGKLCALKVFLCALVSRPARACAQLRGNIARKSTLLGRTRLCRWKSVHWRRLLKNIVGKPKYWGQWVIMSDESIGVSQLFRACARAAPP